MDLAEVRKLVRLVLRAELSELEIDDSNRGVRVHLKRDTGGGRDAAAAMGPVVQVMPGAGVTAAAAPAVGAPSPSLALEVDEGEVPPGMEVMKSPMVGTFYRAPSPDAEPFSEVGTSVTEDSVICIIEAMKVMNEIKAELNGTIIEILVENGEPVEFGQPLFLVTT